MKVLVVLSALVVSCLVGHGFAYQYGYSAIAPLSPISPLIGYGGYAAPYSYGYSSPLIAAPLAAPIAPIAPVPALAAKTQYHSQNEAGEASYGHTEPTQAHHAVQDAHGNKIGSYSYVDPHGFVHQTDYVADALGYRAAANDLPVDTPAQVEAKSLHFAAKAGLVHLRRRRALYSTNVHGWGIPAVLANGHIADTPEVAAAKAAHYAEHAKAAGGYIPAPVHAAPLAPIHSGYYGPYANTVVRPDGFLADTPEVAAAKAAHFAEKAKVAGHPVAVHAAVPYAGQYTHSQGLWAVPYVKPDGFLADTPEVAAAKAAHLQEHYRGKRSALYTPASTSLLPTPLIHPVTPYAAPLAYSAPLAYASPIAHAPLAYAPAHLGVPAVRTIINHNPGHAVSERVDPILPGLVHY